MTDDIFPGKQPPFIFCRDDALLMFISTLVYDIKQLTVLVANSTYLGRRWNIGKSQHFTRIVPCVTRDLRMTQSWNRYRGVIRRAWPA